VLNEGWLTKDFAPEAWELPYSLMVPPPSQASNLLVPVAVSASHIAFNGIRLEPTWSILGHAAGVAAAMAAASASSRHAVADVDVSQLQARLVQEGQFIRKEQVPKKSPAVWCGASAQWACYYYTDEEERDINAGKTTQQAVCAADGHSYTGGDNKGYPGCGTCYCCQKGGCKQ
jgi:hypothetical protein